MEGYDDTFSSSKKKNNFLYFYGDENENKMQRIFKICLEFILYLFFYKMKAVTNSLRRGLRPHTSLLGAAPQTFRFYSSIECLMG